MKKLGLLLMLLLAMTMQNYRVFAQSVTITLMPGWNWISIPLMDTLDFETALGSFTPIAGDIIKSQWGNASYRADGQWRGSISQFYPGYGYMYKSNRTMPVFLTFNAQQPAPQVIVTTAEPTEITTNSAVCGGNVASSNGDFVFVTVRGICWSTNPNPTFNDNYVEVGDGMGNFTVSLTELLPNVVYYVRAYAVTAMETFYGEEASFSTYSYVDLGLPSGLLWATCNVGANAPEGYGDYFAWGETQPKNYYHWNTYQYYDNEGDGGLTKYCSDSNYGYNGFTDDLITLLPEDDIATTIWGNDWRIPTKEEWEELFQYTTLRYTTQNGVIGQLFTASNGNSLFLPAAGWRWRDGIDNLDSSGLYWSSSLRTDVTLHGWSYLFQYFDEWIQNDSRCKGLSVRPVRSTQ